MLSGLKWLNPLSFVSFCTLSIIGTIASVVGIASGVNSLTGGSLFGGGGSGPSQQTGTTAGGTVYDPFASYRPQFGGQLASMMSPGAQFTSSDPSYQFRFGQGLDALNRTEAAKGMLGSGNRLMDLMNYGQGMASTEYGNQFNRLASLAGTSQTMGSGMGQLQAQQQQGGWNALAQGLGDLAGIFGGTTPSTGTTNMTGFMSDPFGPTASPLNSLWM